jgi:hypothetical protein
MVGGVFGLRCLLFRLSLILLFRSKNEISASPYSFVSPCVVIVVTHLL